MKAREPRRCPVCRGLQHDTETIDIPADGPMVQDAFGQLGRYPAGTWTFEIFVNGERCPDVTQITIDVHDDSQTSQPRMQIHVFTESAPPQKDRISGRWTVHDEPGPATP